MHISELDKLDVKILNLIKDNARLSYTEIAKVCGVTRVSVKNRIEAMEEKGIIRGYRTIIDSGESENGIKFFVNIECHPDRFDVVRDKLKDDSIVRELYISSGYCRLHAVCVAPNSRSMREFVGKLYDSLDGVKNVGVNAVMTTIKNVDGGIVDEEGVKS